MKERFHHNYRLYYNKLTLRQSSKLYVLKPVNLINFLQNYINRTGSMRTNFTQNIRFFHVVQNNSPEMIQIEPLNKNRK